MPELTPIVRRFIEDAGNMTQSFGLGRVLGQIFAYLYFSSQPRNLADMQEALGVSKGSVSTGVRQLEQWGAVKKVWIKGDRKDYYEASDWFGRILKNAVLDTVGKKMSSYNSLLGEIEVNLSDFQENDDGKFLKERIENMRRFQKRAQGVWGSKLLQHLLK
ncbi:GbsR/MarR family transcriptional regulator [Verrucomicrobiota bacterium]